MKSKHYSPVVRRSSMQEQMAACSGKSRVLVRALSESPIAHIIFESLQFQCNHFYSLEAPLAFLICDISRALMVFNQLCCARVVYRNHKRMMDAQHQLLEFLVRFKRGNFKA